MKEECVRQSFQPVQRLVFIKLMLSLCYELIQTYCHVMQFGMTILPPSHLNCPRFTPCGFPPPCKDGGAGMGQDFSLTPWGGVGMGLEFLDLPCPAPPFPVSFPVPMLIRVINVNFYPKPYYLNKHINISLFYSTQCSSLPLFCYALYYEKFFFGVILSC